MIDMQEAAGDDIIEGLMEHMDSEELIDRFDHFAMHATTTQEFLESTEAVDDNGVPYCIIAQRETLPINGREMTGIYVAIWPADPEAPGEFLPTNLSRARHARFLEVDPESELVTEMHHVPTLH